MILSILVVDLGFLLLGAKRARVWEKQRNERLLRHIDSMHYWLTDCVLCTAGPIAVQLAYYSFITYRRN